MRLLYVIFSILLFPFYLNAQPLNSEFNSIIYDQNGIGAVVYDLNTKSIIYEKNALSSFKPASVMKLLTTYAALNTLGPEFRFHTKLFAENKKGNYIENLYIVGDGDPTLTTEQLWLIVRAIKRKKINTIQNVYLDDSIYKTFNIRTGERAYQSGNSGLPFNFNAIDFELCAGNNHNLVNVNIDPWEYKPQIMGGIKSVKGSSKGYAISEIKNSKFPNMSYQISGEVPFTNSCIETYRSVENPIQYLTAVLKDYFRILGIKVFNITRKELINSKLPKLYIHSSKSLSQIIEDMNHFSNNFIAEQIVVALDKNNPKHKLRENGLLSLTNYARSFSQNSSEFNIVDASGLSHENRLSPLLLTNLLISAYENPYLSVDFIKSLPVGGVSGTLKKRKLSFNNGVVRAKTGTIDGVSSLVGYVFRKDKKYAFVIIQNSGLSPIKKHQFEEKVIQILFTR